MIKSIRGLKCFFILIWFMSFCCAMDDYDPEFQQALEESRKLSLIQEEDDEEAYQKAIQQSLQASETDDITYKQLITSEKEKELNNFAEKIQKKSFVLENGLPMFSEIQNEFFKKIKELDHTPIVFPHHQKKKSVAVKYNDQSQLIQFQGLYQSYPGLNKIYGDYANLLCGFYSSYFLFHLLINKSDQVIKILNNRINFNNFLDQALKNFPKNTKSLELYHDQLVYPLQVVDSSIKTIEFCYVVVERIEMETISQEEEKIQFKVYHQNNNHKIINYDYPINLEEIARPFFQENKSEKSLGMIIQIGVKQGGKHGHWIAGAVRINPEGGLIMSIVDSKNVDRVDDKDVVVQDLFKYLINIYEKNASIKKIQPIKKEDSLSTLTKLLQVLKQKLVNLLAQIHKITTLSN